MPLKLHIEVKWDIYNRPHHNPDLLYNHFRIETGKSVEGGLFQPQCVQDWYNEVKRAGDDHEADHEVDQGLTDDQIAMCEAYWQLDPAAVQTSCHNKHVSQQNPISCPSTITEATLCASRSNTKRARARSTSTGTLGPLVSCCWRDTSISTALLPHAPYNNLALSMVTGISGMQEHRSSHPSEELVHKVQQLASSVYDLTISRDRHGTMLETLNS